MFTLVMMSGALPNSTIAMANSVRNDVVTDSPSPHGFIGNLSLLARLATVAIKPEHLLENSTERCELKRRGLTLITAHISPKPYQLRNSHTHSVMNQFPKYRQKTQERYFLFEPPVPSFSSLDFILVRHGHREHLGSFLPRFVSKPAHDQRSLYCDSGVGFLDRYKEQAGQ